MGFNGSERYWEIKEHAERIYRKKAEARSSSEREIWAERGRNFADRLREEYGINNRDIRYIIEEYGLDRS